MDRRISHLGTRTLLAAACLSGAASGRANELDLIGFTALNTRLHGIAGGVPVAQVEVPADGASAYGPDTSDPALAGKTFTYRSGAATVSVHASEVASFFYGGSGPARGVTDVSLFTADSFIANVLRSGRSRRAPGAVGASIVNNSWVGSFTNDAKDADVIRRLDDLIDRDDVLAFNAMQNDQTTPFPRLMATSFNGITVGTLTGSRGPVTFDSTGGRLKPDLVVNVAKTSDATALASGAGEVLRSQARNLGLKAGQLAIKSMLMAGAERDASWRRGRLSGADNATTPLDFQQGAGQLRVDRSYDILAAGKYPSGSTVPKTGWDTARMARGQTEAVYLVHVAQDLAAWSAVLTWNRDIAGINAESGRYDSTPTMADFQLGLYVGKKSGRRMVGYSDSLYDNVETLTLTDLAAGDYQLVVTGDLRSYYGLSWIGDVSAVTPLGGAIAVDVEGGAIPDGGFAAVPEPWGLGAGIFAGFALKRPLRRKR